ncbi:ABC transporter permease [Calycomorphotria hydatis]|uniref:Ribose transport system permease protein RbsC n=1 Tax=Calycomorphotria hydatis TaxID=2528027 RepID=A0A517T830_9PLAN|nr:ABC transporter permease [Calycomorphotria hydatis]QDT64539.1 Ribose transport system permease protein RbsC [Calycomorphotria hydatis]
MEFTHKYRNELGLLIAIAVVALVTGFFDDSYRQNPVQNLQLLMKQTSLLGIFALGAGVVIISGGIDLSSGSVIAFSATICGSITLLLAPLNEAGRLDLYDLSNGVVITAILGTLLASILVGTFHAWLITAIKLPPFVATLASLIGLRSLSRLMVPEVFVIATNGGPPGSRITVYDETFRALYKEWYIPPAIFAAVALATWFLLSKTVAGRHLYAMGGNEEAARLSGIRTERLKWLAYGFAAFTSALAGILYLAQSSSADPATQGLGYELNAIAAAVIGGCALTGGVGTVPGIVLGTIFLRIAIDSVQKLATSDTSPDVLEGLVVGLLILLAVAFNELRSGEGLRRPFFKGAMGMVTIGILTILSGIIAGILTEDRPALVSGITAGVVFALLVTKKLLEVRADRAKRG